MSHRQERQALKWAAKIQLADNEETRFALGWEIMELEEERDRYLAALQSALDIAQLVHL